MVAAGGRAGGLRRHGVERRVGGLHEVAVAEELAAQVVVERVEEALPPALAVVPPPLPGDGALGRQPRGEREEPLHVRQAARGHLVHGGLAGEGQERGQVQRVEEPAVAAAVVGGGLPVAWQYLGWQQFPGLLRRERERERWRLDEEAVEVGEVPPRRGDGVGLDAVAARRRRGPRVGVERGRPAVAGAGRRRHRGGHGRVGVVVVV